MAADALGTYQGAGIVEVLIPLLDDLEEIIRKETSSNLLGQRDKKMLRQCLERTVAGAPSERVRVRAKELLAQLVVGQ